MCQIFLLAAYHYFGILLDNALEEGDSHVLSRRSQDQLSRPVSQSLKLPDLLSARLLQLPDDFHLDLGPSLQPEGPSQSQVVIDAVGLTPRHNSSLQNPPAPRTRDPYPGQISRSRLPIRIKLWHFPVDRSPSRGAQP